MKDLEGSEVLDVLEVKKLEGKGMGVVAKQNLEPGCLVLTEIPALYVTPELDGHAETIQAFAELEPNDQEKLLQLCNMYSIDENLWTDEMRKELQFCITDAGDISSINVPKETAIKVWQIWLTNAYDNGIFFLLSRFNHSCQPNTEYFWNTEDDEWKQEVRAIRRIKKGEELTVCYRSFWPSNKTERQEVMRQYNFDCLCDGCNVSKEKEEKEAHFCNIFKQIDEKRFHLKQSSKEDLDSEVTYLKQMNRLAKEIPTISLKNILSIIAEEGYVACCRRLLRFNQDCQLNKTSLPSNGLHELKEFLTLGLELSTLLHGEKHSLTFLWHKRQQQPLECFLDEQM